MPVPWPTGEKAQWRQIDKVEDRAITVQQLRDLHAFLERLCKTRLLKRPRRSSGPEGPEQTRETQPTPKRPEQTQETQPTNVPGKEPGRADGEVISIFEIDMYDIANLVLIPAIEYVEAKRGGPRPKESKLEPEGGRFKGYSWVELVATEGAQETEVMFSHCWKGRFQDFMSVVNRLDRDMSCGGGKKIWICTFANNQFGEDFGNALEESPFYKAVVSSKEVVLVVDRFATSLQRTWCAFELFVAHKKNRPLSVYTSMGKVGHEVTTGPLADAICKWDVMKTECSEDPDRRQILNYLVGGRKHEKDGLKLKEDRLFQLTETHRKLLDLKETDEDYNFEWPRLRNGMEYSHEAKLFKNNKKKFKGINTLLRGKVKSATKKECKEGKESTEAPHREQGVQVGDSPKRADRQSSSGSSLFTPRDRTEASGQPEEDEAEEEAKTCITPRSLEPSEGGRPMRLRGITLGEVRKAVKKLKALHWEEYQKEHYKKLDLKACNDDWEALTLRAVANPEGGLMYREQLWKDWELKDDPAFAQRSFAERVCRPRTPQYIINDSQEQGFQYTMDALEWMAEALQLTDSAVLFISSFCVKDWAKDQDDFDKSITTLIKNSYGWITILGTKKTDILRSNRMEQLQICFCQARPIYFACSTGIIAGLQSFALSSHGHNGSCWEFGVFDPRIARVLLKADWEKEAQSKKQEIKDRIVAFIKEGSERYGGFAGFHTRVACATAGPVLRDAVLHSSPAAVDKVAKLCRRRGLKINSKLLKGALGETPLHIAAAVGNVGAMEVLLAANADPNAEDNILETPLHYAAMTGQADAARCLLGKGALSHVESAYAESPLAVAKQNPAGFLGVDPKSVIALLESWDTAQKAKQKALEGQKEEHEEDYDFDEDIVAAWNQLAACRFRAERKALLQEAVCLCRQNRMMRRASTTVSNTQLAALKAEQAADGAGNQPAAPPAVAGKQEARPAAGGASGQQEAPKEPAAGAGK